MNARVVVVFVFAVIAFVGADAARADLQIGPPPRFHEVALQWTTKTTEANGQVRRVREVFVIESSGRVSVSISGDATIARGRSWDFRGSARETLRSVPALPDDVVVTLPERAGEPVVAILLQDSDQPGSLTVRGSLPSEPSPTITSLLLLRSFLRRDAGVGPVLLPPSLRDDVIGVVRVVEGAVEGDVNGDGVADEFEVEILFLPSAFMEHASDAPLEIKGDLVIFDAHGVIGRFTPPRVHLQPACDGGRAVWRTSVQTTRPLMRQPALDGIAAFIQAAETQARWVALKVPDNAIGVLRGDAENNLSNNALVVLGPDDACGPTLTLRTAQGDAPLRCCPR